MKKSLRKVLACMFALIMVFSAVPLTVSAMEYSGQCGENAYWSFDKETGTLSITGSGETYDYDSLDRSDVNLMLMPWCHYYDEIKNLVIDDEITKIGNHNFYACINLQSVKADGVTELGKGAFGYCVSLESISLPNAIELGQDAFAGCIVLKNVDVPKAENIGDDAFNLCISMEKINLPSLVSTDGFIFGELSLSLKEVYLGENLESLSRTDFAGTPTLEKVYFYGKDTVIPEHLGMCSYELNDSYEVPDVVDIMRNALIIECEAYYNASSDESPEFNDEYHQKFNDFRENGFIFYDEPQALENLVIYGYTGSTAEAYANANGITFVSLDEKQEDGAIIVAPEEENKDFVVVEIEDKNDLDYVLVESLISGGLAGLYDIKMVDDKGNPVQPESTVKVKLPVGDAEGPFSIYRVEEDGTLTNMNAYRDGDYMVFITDHFSLYVVVDEGAAETPEEDEGNKEENSCGEGCICLCHAHPLLKFIFVVLNIVMKFLGVEPLCTC